MTCGRCRACREGRDNLCEDVSGVMGFHLDGFARELVTLPARLAVKVPDGVSDTDAACAGIAFGTVQHMLFDNARLEPGESVLVHAGGSGIGTAAIRMAKAIGCTVYTTVGDDEKGRRAADLGADHVINYRTERFEGEVRRLTKRKGVDVVFEHVGADTWNGSLLCLKRGGRLVTCGSTSGVSATINLMQLFQQQYRITGSFGCSLANIGQSLDKMAARHPAGRRHRLPAVRLRAGARAARVAPRLRQDPGQSVGAPRSRRRPPRGASFALRQTWLKLRLTGASGGRPCHALESNVLRLALLLKRSYPRLAGYAMIPLIRALVWLARALGPARSTAFGAAVLRTLGPLLPAHRTALANLRAAFPEMPEARAEADRPGGMGQSRADGRGVRPSRYPVRLRSRGHRAVADRGLRASSISSPCATTASRG